MEQIYSVERLDYSEIYPSKYQSLAEKLKQTELKRLEQMKLLKNKTNQREAHFKNKTER